MSSASTRPQPPAWVTQMACASHSPRAAALSPSSGKPSGVNDMSPLNERGSSTPASGGTLSAKCPNCGAPLDLDLAGECKYCKAPVSSGSYDWVLARIAQVPAYY